MDFGNRSGRTSRRAAAALGLAGLGILLVPGAALSEPAQVDAPGQAAFEAIMDAASAEELAPVEASTAAERDATLTEFSGLSDAEALRLARAEFPSLSKASLVPELDLSPGVGIDEFLSPTTARLTLPKTESDSEALPPIPDPDAPGAAGPGLLLESTLPLRAPEDGSKELLEGELVVEGDHYEAENALVEAELPMELDDGIELPRSGVTITPDVDEETDPVESGDVLFHANADTDTDTMITATATGASISYQLRSVDSPERLPLEASMPAGAALQATADGGAEIRRDGDTIATITAPVAWDAAGTPVPASYEIAGDQLTIAVAHQDGDYLRPIAVDPTVVDNYPWGQNQPSPNYDYWQPISTGNPLFSAFYNSGDGGLMNRATPGTYYGGEMVEWVANPIRSSYVERMDFFNFDRRPTSPGACTILGIWNTNAYGWAVGTAVDASSGTYTYNQPFIQKCDNVAHDTRHFWVGNSDTPDSFANNAGDPEGVDGAAGVFALTTNAGNRTSKAENVLRAANVYRFDRNLPAVTAPTTAWTKDPVVTVSDYGLGGWGANIWEGAGASAVYWGAVTDSCTGAHQAPCPIHSALHPQLPEGLRTFTAVGYDVATWGSAATTFQTRVDRSGPSVDLSGSLWDRRNDYPASVGPGQSFNLNVNAYEGQTTPNSSQRAGVKQIKIYVTGRLAGQTSAQTCPASSCSQSMSWALNTDSWEEGPQQILVEATDQAGNVTYKELWVNIAKPLGQEGPTVRDPASSYCTAQLSPITAADVAAFDEADNTPQVTDDLAAEFPCVLTDPLLQRSSGQWCFDLINHQRFNYPLGFYKYWVEAKTRFCVDYDRKKVKRRSERLTYDFSAVFDADHNMEQEPSRTGQEHMSYKNWNNGMLEVHYMFPIEHCVGPSPVCLDDPRFLHNRAAYTGEMWWSDND